MKAFHVVKGFFVLVTQGSLLSEVEKTKKSRPAYALVNRNNTGKEVRI